MAVPTRRILFTCGPTLPRALEGNGNGEESRFKRTFGARAEAIAFPTDEAVHREKIVPSLKKLPSA